MVTTWFYNVSLRFSPAKWKPYFETFQNKFFFSIWPCQVYHVLLIKGHGQIKKIISPHAYLTGTSILQKRWEISWRFQICPRFLRLIPFKRDIGLNGVLFYFVFQTKVKVPLILSSFLIHLLLFKTPTGSFIISLKLKK